MGDYARVKAWRASNPEKWAEQSKRYAQKYPEKRVAAVIKWKNANPDKAAEVAKKSRIKHKDRVNANKAFYRATKRNRTPAWLTDFDKLKIKCIYSIAVMLTKENKEEWHVDHIIPLNGKNVSGLHVPSNLWFVKGEENRFKNNKYEVEYA